MKDCKLTVTISKPVEEVFAFTIDPKNTPKWVASIVAEQTNEWPVKLGTIYRNQRQNGEWSDYEITEFETNKAFVMRQKNDSFHVGYAFTPASDGAATMLEYRVWTDKGELPDSLTTDALNDILEKLKQAVEA
jgi:uncharacterized protein YndB with AHSA1/START domain